MAPPNGTPPPGVLMDLGVSDVQLPSGSGGAMGYSPGAKPGPRAPKTPQTYQPSAAPGPGGPKPVAPVASKPAAAPSGTKTVAMKKKKAGKKKVGVRVRAQLSAGDYLHVRHMDDGQSVEALADGSFRLRDFRQILQGQTVDPASIGVALKGPATWADGSAKQLVWVQIAEVGAWKGHSAGPFEMTSATFADIVRNFDRRGLPVPMDMEHASESDATSGSIPERGAPAQGWIHKLESRGPKGLWGLVEWLQYARDGIQAGNFAFLSPAIRFNSRDPVTGENVGARLTSAAITNQPFLSRLEGLRAATDRPEEAAEQQQEKKTMADFQIKGGPKSVLASDRSGLKPEEYMPPLRAALGLPPLASAKKVQKSLAALRDHVETAGDADGVAEGVSLSDFTRPLAHLVGAKAGDAWDDVFDALDALVALSLPKTAPAPEPPPAAAAGAPETEAPAEITSPLAAAATVTLTEKDTAMANATTETEKPKDHSSEIAELTLGLKDLQGKVSETEKLVTAKDAEIVALKADIAKRDDAARVARVEEAFETYKDKKNLTDDDKEAMTIVLSSKPEAFEKLYPRVSPGQRHLLRDLTTKRAPHAGGAVPPSAADGASTEETPSLAVLALRLSEEKGIELSEAQAIVYAASVRANTAA